MNWEYLRLRDGRLVTEAGHDANRNWPSFATITEAEAYLTAEDIRATVVN